MERTFPEDIEDRDELRRMLMEFCDEVAYDLRSRGLRGRTITLKARFKSFRTVTRTKTIDYPTNLGRRIYATARELLERVPPGALRLLGVQVSNLGDVRAPAQGTLFGELDQQVWDLTFRSSVLFNRDQSLQLYVQPFLTQGDYADPRWLATPDSYDLRPYDIQVSDYDFNYGALNLNLVYRWEYRPGSTIYIVWTHSQERYEERGMAGAPNDWDNEFDFGYPLGVEPGNTILAKISYWFSI